MMNVTSDLVKNFGEKSVKSNWSLNLQLDSFLIYAVFGALWIGIIFAYPLGLLGGPIRLSHRWVFFNLPYEISLNGLLLTGLLGLGLCFFYQIRAHISFWLWLVSYILGLIIGYPRDWEYVMAWLDSLAIVGVVIGMIILRRECPWLRIKPLSYILGSIWLWQMGVCLYQIWTNTPPTGISGNVNWQAALLLALTPWTVLTIISLQKHFYFSKMVTIITLLISCGLTGYVLFYTHSRAAWLGAFFCPVFIFFYWLSSNLERILCGLLIIVAGITLLYAGYTFFPSYLFEVVSRDVRLPMWSSTARMIIHHPWGVGAGRFRYAFPRYRIGPYHHRLVAADLSIHPHNEMLNWGAQFGVCGLWSGIFLFYFLCKGRWRGLSLLVPRVSLFFLLWCSLFDMTMVQAPTNLLSYAMLGFCMPAIAIRSSSRGKLGSLGICWIKNLGVISLVIISGFFLGVDLYQEFYLRQARIALFFARQNRSESQTFYQQAYQAFLQSTTKFQKISGYYELATLDLNVFNRIGQAKTFLTYIQEREPDFAHIHFLFARLYLLEKNIPQVIHHLMQECELFPWRVEPWWMLYSLAMEMNRYPLAVYAYQQIKNILQTKSSLIFSSQKEYEEEKIRFQSYIRQKETKKLLDLANKMLERFPQRLIDPLGLLICTNTQWLQIMRGSDISLFDINYWCFRYQIWEHLYQGFPNGPGTLDGLVHWFLKEYRFKPIAEFDIPSHTFQKREGNWNSLAYCFGVYLDLLDWPMILKVDEKGDIESLLVFQGTINWIANPPNRDLQVKQKIEKKGRWYEVNLVKGELNPLPEISLSFLQKGCYRLPFYPESVLVRQSFFSDFFFYPFLIKDPLSLQTIRLFYSIDDSIPWLYHLPNLFDKRILERYENILSNKGENQNKKPISPFYPTEIEKDKILR